MTWTQQTEQENFERAMNPDLSAVERTIAYMKLKNLEHRKTAWASISGEPCDEGVKADDGKPRPSLLFVSMPDAVRSVIDVLEHGARKYAPDNWRKVADGEARYLDAAFRHLLAHAAGEELDPESGLPHIAHAICSLLFVLQLTAERE